MASIDLTTLGDALKPLLKQENFEVSVYRNNPLLGMLPKSTDFVGSEEWVVLQYGDPAARSATASTAITNSASAQIAVEKFVVTRALNYYVAAISGEVLAAADGKMGSFLSAAKATFDGGIRQITNDIACSLFTGGYGVRGNINATVSGTTLTLLNIAAISNFEKGMSIVFSESEAGHTLRDSGEALTVTAIDRELGTMTVSANLTSISGLASGDFIFAEGDRQNSATPARIKLAGLAAWVPVAAPASTSFFGVDRTVDATRLGGCRYSANGAPIKEALVTAASKVDRQGAGMVDTFVVSPTVWAQLANQLGTQVRYDMVKANSKAAISFESIIVNGPGGKINVISDRNCPDAYGWGLDLNTWELASMGPLVHVVEDDGNKMIRQSTADGVEVRMRSMSNLFCRKPAANIAVTF